MYAAFLIFLKEFQLLAKDRVGCFMLTFAPVVIIAVAGFSLGNIYGAHPGANAYLLPVVDQDHGAVADAIITALKREHVIIVSVTDDLGAARQAVNGQARTPLVIVIPPGTTAALTEGRTGQLLLYVDPVKRLEVNTIELRLGELCREVTAHARRQAQAKLASGSADRRLRLDRLGAELSQLQTGIVKYREEAAKGRAKAEADLQAQLERANRETGLQIRVVRDHIVAQIKAKVAGEVSARSDALLAVKRYLIELQQSQEAFDRWLVKLKAAAGSRSGDFPPPPTFPAPPSAAALARLAAPLEIIAPDPPSLPTLALESIKLPDLPSSPAVPSLADSRALVNGVVPSLPGDLSWHEPSAEQANAFDQYVPGFGITFLLIGMLMGVGLGLIDERDWGTLQRLRVSGAPLASVLAGKVVARFFVGLIQMSVLFVLGRIMFGISLGRSPTALLLPTAAICFAGASFGLVVACIARTHDSVMPIGAVVAMAMSAIGGCWWPLDFEPSWMRALAQWLPTTWTMEAYNDLMIRGLEPSSILVPSAVTVGLGALYLVIGFIGARRLYE